MAMTLRSPAQGVSLPPGFFPIGHLLSGKVPLGKLVNVIGLVKDYQPPAPTRGTGKFAGTGPQPLRQVALYADMAHMAPARLQDVHHPD